MRSKWIVLWGWSVVSLILLAGCASSVSVKAPDEEVYLDISEYDYGRISSKRVKVSQLAESSDRSRFVPADMVFKIGYEQLQVEDKRIVDENHWYKEGDIFEIRLFPV